MDWEPRVGMKVVCVDDTYEYIAPGDPAFFEERPVKGQIYTIRGLCSSPLGVSVFLVEIVNRSIHYLNGFGEVSFRAGRFRPLDERRIDVFRAMLVNPPKELAYTMPGKPFE